MATRRINKALASFVEAYELSNTQRDFYTGLLLAQKSYPQLTLNQWNGFKSLLNYLSKHGKRRTNTTERESA